MILELEKEREVESSATGPVGHGKYFDFYPAFNGKSLTF